MLKWREPPPSPIYNAWRGYSGTALVADVSPNGLRRWWWKMTGLYQLVGTNDGRGTCPSTEEAQAAAEKAWVKWLDGVGLARKTDVSEFADASSGRCVRRRDRRVPSMVRCPQSGASMFGLFSRFKYRTELFVNVMQLLILYPGGADALKNDYPGIKSAIADHAKKETPIHYAAVMIAASVLGDLATKVPEDAKPVINEQLRALDYAQFHEYLVQHLRGETSIKLDKSITYGTMIFAAAFCIGDQWAEDGKVERDNFRLITSEVVGALRGLSPGERSSGRIMRALDAV